MTNGNGGSGGVHSLHAGAMLGDGMPLAQRSNLVMLDRQLHQAWGLGANVILSWSAGPDCVDVLMVPHYAVAECSDRGGTTGNGRRVVSADLIRALISGRRELTPERMRRVAGLLGTEPTPLRLSRPLTGSPRERELIEQMIRRYSISYVASRAVALFDIVGFSLLSPFEQMTQLNSLSYSINAAHSRMMARRLGINFARSSTGDGFYLWNRDTGLQADVDLYHFMQLVLADNAIARRKAVSRAVPLLRTGFHMGSCYEFHQAEGLNPTLYDYIVGDVTIELARMIERALPGQILVGEFAMPEQVPQAVDEDDMPDTVRFMRHAQHTLARLNGLELAGERIEAIKCYLTGQRTDNGGYSVRRLTIADKHGLSRNVFNAKVNIYQRSADPILLGLEDRVIAGNPLQERLSRLLTPATA